MTKIEIFSGKEKIFAQYDNGQSEPTVSIVDDIKSICEALEIIEESKKFLTNYAGNLKIRKQKEHVNENFKSY